MYENPNTAFLPDILLELSRAKNCRKASFRKKWCSVTPACQEQNALRALLKKIRPAQLTSVEDPHFGIDYVYNTTSIDQKFSFGELGKNTIKIRVLERELINNSQWTMIVNEAWEAEFFQTQDLARFVKRNWSLVQRRLIEKKATYATYAVKLDEFYRFENVTPRTIPLTQQALTQLLLELTQPQEELSSPAPVSFTPKNMLPQAPYVGPYCPLTPVMHLK